MMGRTFFVGAMAGAAITALATAVLLNRKRRNSKPTATRPKVGVAVIVEDRKTSRIVMGIRINSHGDGTWQFPGGHLENGESPQSTAARELKEEAGIVIKPSDFRVVSITNDVFTPAKHYITIHTHAFWNGQQPQTMEPNKCLGWSWKSWEDIRALSPLFLPVDNLLQEQLQPFKTAN